MDAAYDDPNIREHSKSLGHVPLIDRNTRRNKELKVELETEAKARNTLNWKPAEAIRYNERSTAERANARLKDEFGGRKVRVRGNIKVACHLMFGVLALAADHLLKNDLSSLELKNRKVNVRSTIGHFSILEHSNRFAIPSKYNPYTS